MVAGAVPALAVGAAGLSAFEAHFRPFMEEQGKMV